MKPCKCSQCSDFYGICYAQFTKRKKHKTKKKQVKALEREIVKKKRLLERMKAKRCLVIILITFSLLNASPSKADEAYESAHAWDHIGISFALQTVFYGFASKGLELDKTDSLILSTFLTFALTFTYSYMQALNRNDNTGERLCKDTLLNGLGQGLAVGNIRVWSW